VGGSHSVKVNYSDCIVDVGLMHHPNANGLMNLVSQNKRLQRESDLCVICIHRRRSGDGSTGSGSSSTMSGSVKNRRKSPVPVRRDRGDKEKGSSDGGTPHLPHPELASSQGSQEEGTNQSGGTEDEVE
jgi:hypothetical protein